MKSFFSFSGSKPVMIMVFSGLLVGGIYLMICGFQAILDAHDSPRWNSVSATIEKSALVGRRSNQPSVLYSYIVGGKEFTSACIAPGVTAYNGQASQIISRFPKGTQQTAYVCPNDPSRAFLESGLHPHNFTEFVAGCFCFSVAMLVALSYLIASRFGKKRIEVAFSLPRNLIVAKLNTLGTVLVIALVVLFCWLVSN